MVVLRILDIPLDDSVNHEATDWQVSTTLNFSNIILESLEDYDNKTAIAFNTVLNPNVKYYARARALLSTGYTTWGNLEIFTPENIYDLDKNENIPSRVSIPVLTTSSDVEYHNSTLFTLSVSGFSTVSNATHEATSWFIETLDGDVIWSRLYSTIHKNSIDVSDVILEDSKHYRIRAMFHSSSNDASQLATKTIYVKDKTGIILYSDRTNIDVTIDNIIRIFPFAGLDALRWEILYVDNNKVEVMWTSDTIGSLTYTTLPSDSLLVNHMYILRIFNYTNNSYSYFNFFTYHHTSTPV